MNTKSITSMAALLGVAVTFNVSALAGPGPHEPVQPRKVGQPKQAAVTIALAGTAHHSVKAETKSEAKLTQRFGPRGVTYGFRR